MSLKITKVSCSITRQVQQFQPVVFSMEAEVPSGGNPEEIAKELQRIVIRVLYKDSPVLRDDYIKKIIDCDKSQKVSPLPNQPNF